jgi:hypothetical protein
LISFDPILASIYLSQSGEMRLVFPGLSRNDKYVSLNNGIPGLRSARILVNGALFANFRLVDGESQVLDISGALLAGGNTVVVEGFGYQGASADVSIGEIPGAARGLAVAAPVSGGGVFINLPNLQILRQGNQAVLSWPTTGPAGEDFTQYQLQVSPTGAPGSWSVAAASAVNSGALLSVTVTPGASPQFYQLANPTAP